VPFYSVAGFAGDVVDDACDGGWWSTPTRTDPLNPVLIVGHTLIQTIAAATDDGVVNTRNMRFGTFLGCVPADHLEWQGLATANLVEGHSDDTLSFVVELWRGLDAVARTGDGGAMRARATRLAQLAGATPREAAP
jgi:hypothetical protein